MIQWIKCLFGWHSKSRIEELKLHPIVGRLYVYECIYCGHLGITR